MGQAAQRRRQARTALRDLRASQREMDGQLAADPGLQERLADLHDEECAALVKRDWHDQSRALTALGWQQVRRNLDGIGSWRRRDQQLTHSVAREADGQVWAHISLSNRGNTMPGWYEVQRLSRLLYPDRFGIIPVAPESRHVNIANVIHVWVCLTADSCPDFSHGMNSI
jgi:hypothetical protein